jgi:hypothetical protein
MSGVSRVVAKGGLCKLLHTMNQWHPLMRLALSCLQSSIYRLCYCYYPFPNLSRLTSQGRLLGHLIKGTANLSSDGEDHAAPFRNLRLGPIPQLFPADAPTGLQNME